MGQVWSESRDVPKVEEGLFGDGFDVGPEGEGGVQDDAQVADLRGWADGNAINQKDEITHLLEQCRGRHNQELCFIAVEFK